MTCYELVHWRSHDDPYLKNVPVSVILTMENSPRQLQFETHGIHKICKNTFVQHNRGYKTCTKSMCVQDNCFEVHKPYQDLFHALLNCFKEFEEVKDPILVMEDDCELLKYDQIRKHMFKVDTFVLNEHFDVYTLGSNFPRAARENGHLRITSDYSGAHAVIYSYNVRQVMLQTAFQSQILHIDEIVSLYNLKHVYTYRKPLAIQKWPMTENANGWMTPKKKIALVLTAIDKGNPLPWKLIYFFAGYKNAAAFICFTPFIILMISGVIASVMHILAKASSRS